MGIFTYKTKGKEGGEKEVHSFKKKKKSQAKNCHDSLHPLLDPDIYTIS